jgi:GxxExxY protein
MREPTDAAALKALSGLVIGRAFTVLNTLGAGFHEKVYENALALELREHGISFARQRGITVLYNGAVVGEFVADFLIEDVLLVELKAVKTLDDSYVAQCTNYLKATGLRLCLLLNFGKPRLEVKRVANGL